MHGQLQGGLQEVLKGALQEAISLNIRVLVFQMAKRMKKAPFPFQFRSPQDALLNGKKLELVTVKLGGKC